MFQRVVRRLPDRDPLELHLAMRVTHPRLLERVGLCSSASRTANSRSADAALDRSRSAIKANVETVRPGPPITETDRRSVSLPARLRPGPRLVTHHDWPGAGRGNDGSQPCFHRQGRLQSNFGRSSSRNSLRFRGVTFQRVSSVSSNVTLYLPDVRSN